MKIVALSICMKDTIHAAASDLVNFAMVSYVKEVKVVNIQLIIRKMTCFNWKMKKCHVTIYLWIIQK